MHLSPFTAWSDFYVIVGSSAAALTGLQFVVIVLGSEVGALSTKAMKAFGTPIVVHFCAALVVSAILEAPWMHVRNAAFCLVAVALVGILYMARAFHHGLTQDSYKPVFEDWLWHFSFPSLGYIALLIAACLLVRYTHVMLFVVAAATVGIVLVAIHNAWDSVTYIAVGRREELEAQQKKESE